MVLRIASLFGSISVQSVPTLNRRRFGVPPRGPFDIRCHELANALLGNPDESPTLEISAGLTLEVLEAGTLAWVGAGSIQGSRRLRKGETFGMAYPSNGVRSYLAMTGGISIDGPVLHSLGDSRGVESTLADPPGKADGLRIVKGPQAGLFDWPRFLGTEFKVSGDSNRMGIRLEAQEPLVHQFDLPSEPTDVGVIQLPPSGNPIILGPDGPTIGGYPKIAWMIQADFPLVGQLGTGELLRFLEVDAQAAAKLFGEQNRQRERQKNLIRAQALSQLG